MSYENAPSTVMLATHCAICARPLRDAKSVDVGIGPECRKKHGFNENVDEEARAAANRIIHAVALARSGGTDLAGDWDALTAAMALAGLGFRKLADVIASRAAAVRIYEDTGVAVNGFPVDHHMSGSVVLRVFAPYSEAANDDWYRMGAKWDKVNKCRVVPAAKKPDLWALLLRHFPGACAVGPSGPFRIEAKASTVRHAEAA